MSWAALPCTIGSPRVSLRDPTNLTPRGNARQAHARSSHLAPFGPILIGRLVMVVAGAIPGLRQYDHYMGLLAANQPWNLLLFMAVPVILAETLAITELALLFKPDVPAVVRGLNRWSGLVAGVWFTGIVASLLTNAAILLTTSSGWRGAGDLLAVGAYLLGIVPLGGITLIELGILGTRSARDRAKLHAVFVKIFLVVAHVAMIFGMLDPSLLGWHAAPADTMPGMSV